MGLQRAIQNHFDKNMQISFQTHVIANRPKTARNRSHCSRRFLLKMIAHHQGYAERWKDFTEDCFGCPAGRIAHSRSIVIQSEILEARTKSTGVWYQGAPLKLMAPFNLSVSRNAVRIP